MTNLPRLNKNPPMPQQQPCKAASATVSNTPSKIPTKTLSQTLSKTKPPHKTSAPHKANTLDKTNSFKNKTQINSGFFLPTHYKRCKATSGNNAVNRLVGILSIVCLLLGCVSATANTAQQQHGSGSNGNAPSNPEALNKETSATLAHEFFISIPPLNAAEALNRLAKQTGAQLLYSYEQALTRKARPVVGQYAVMDALAQLLKGSGLEGSLSNKGAITISDSEKVAQHNQRERMNMNNKTIAKKTLLAAAVGLFAAGGMSTASAQDQINEGARAQSILEEVIVTASKRGAGTSIQDTAMSISALDGDTIEKRGLVGMDDYLRTLPGVSFQDRGAGQNSIVIRGLSTNPQGASSTSSFYFGETPLSGLGSAGQTGQTGNGDIKLVDVERIEVLRGPQSTLYGSGAMGGTVKVLPNAPNLDQVEGKVATRYSQTGEAGGDNTMIQGVINIPIIEDTLAVRAVAYQFDNSGYIDNVAASRPTPRITTVVNDFGAVAENKDDRGNDQYTGFRLSTLWTPTDALDITLTHLQQDIDQDGTPEVDLTLDDYQQRRINIGTTRDRDEYLETKVDVTNLVVNYDLGWGTLTNAASWVDYEAVTGAELVFSWLGEHPFSYDNDLSVETFTEELRFASAFDGDVQFVAGLYYEDSEREWHTFWDWAGDPSMVLSSTISLASVGPFSKLDDIISTKQKAFFGEVTYNITDQYSVVVGGRHFDYEREKDSTLFTQLFTATAAGAFLWEDRVEIIEETGQNYKVGLNFTPNEDALFYAQWAEGFRLGSGQTASTSCRTLGITVPSIKSDSTENFEIGAKLAFADNRVTLNTAIYQVNWEDIPVLINTNGCFRTENFGKAKSEGIEIELQAQWLENLRVDISMSYTEAELEETTSIGTKGDPLPGSADFNLSTGIQYDFTLANYDSFIRIDYSYFSEYHSNLAESGEAAGGFGQVNTSLGMNVDQWAISLFANNLINENGLTWVETSNTDQSGTTRAYRIRPRTIGLNLSYEF